MVISKTVKKENSLVVADKKAVFNDSDIFSVLKRPRVTEKSSVVSEGGVYVFEISERANKNQVKDAVKQMYKVTPVRINISRVPAKKVVRRGVKGVVSGAKKAFVYLKKGDKIELV